MICYIFGALKVTEFPFQIENGDMVIAADMGFKNMKRLGIEPDYIIGDFDSLGYVPKERNTVVPPVKKDDTDTLLAVKFAFEKGYKDFRIFGGVGGRLDHTVSNIQTADYIAENGGSCVFFGDNENFTVIKNGRINFDEKCRGNISVFALEKSKNINISGLYYRLENGELTPDFPLGASNKFNKEKSSVSVGSGKLLIIWENRGGTLNSGEITYE